MEAFESYRQALLASKGSFDHLEVAECIRIVSKTLTEAIQTEVVRQRFPPLVFQQLKGLHTASSCYFISKTNRLIEAWQHSKALWSMQLMERRTSRGPQVGCWLRKQNTEGATCHSSQLPIGATGENYWDLSSHHNSCCQRSGQVLKFLKEDISCLQIRDHQEIGVTRDLRFYLLDPCGITRNGIVKGEWTIDDGSGNLTAIGHFAKGGGVKRRWNGRIN